MTVIACVSTGIGKVRNHLQTLLHHWKNTLGNRKHNAKNFSPGLPRALYAPGKELVTPYDAKCVAETSLWSFCVAVNEGWRECLNRLGALKEKEARLKSFAAAYEDSKETSKPRTQAITDEDSLHDVYISFEALQCVSGLSHFLGSPVLKTLASAYWRLAIFTLTTVMIIRLLQMKLDHRVVQSVLQEAMTPVGACYRPRVQLHRDTSTGKTLSSESRRLRAEQLTAVRLESCKETFRVLDFAKNNMLSVSQPDLGFPSHVYRELTVNVGLLPGIAACVNDDTTRHTFLAAFHRRYTQHWNPKVLPLLLERLRSIRIYAEQHGSPSYLHHLWYTSFLSAESLRHSLDDVQQHILQPLHRGVLATSLQRAGFSKTFFENDRRSKLSSQCSTPVGCDAVVTDSTNFLRYLGWLLNSVKPQFVDIEANEKTFARFIQYIGGLYHVKLIPVKEASRFGRSTSIGPLFTSANESQDESLLAVFQAFQREPSEGPPQSHASASACTASAVKEKRSLGFLYVLAKKLETQPPFATILAPGHYLCSVPYPFPLKDKTSDAPVMTSPLFSNNWEVKQVQAIFHEIGHAIHFMHWKRSAPFQRLHLARSGFTDLTETPSQLTELLTGLPSFRREFLSSVDPFFHATGAIERRFRSFLPRVLFTSVTSQMEILMLHKLDPFSITDANALYEQIRSNLQSLFPFPIPDWYNPLADKSFSDWIPIEGAILQIPYLLGFLRASSWFAKFNQTEAFNESTESKKGKPSFTKGSSATAELVMKEPLTVVDQLKQNFLTTIPTGDRPFLVHSILDHEPLIEPKNGCSAIASEPSCSKKRRKASIARPDWEALIRALHLTDKEKRLWMASIR